MRREAGEGGDALRYTLIVALELAKSAREARESGSNIGKKEGARSNRREPGGIFKVIFKVFFGNFFFKMCFVGPLGVLKHILNKKDFWVRTFKRSGVINEYVEKWLFS